MDTTTSSSGPASKGNNGQVFSIMNYPVFLTEPDTFLEGVACAQYSALRSSWARLHCVYCKQNTLHFRIVLTDFQKCVKSVFCVIITNSPRTNCFSQSCFLEQEKNRINKDGELVVTSTKNRTQMYVPSL